MNTSQNQIMEFLAKIDDEINELQQKFVKAMTCENGDNRQLSIIDLKLSECTLLLDNTQFIEKEDRKHRIINIQRIQKSIDEIIQSNQSNEQMNAQSNEQEIEPKNELIIESHNKLKSRVTKLEIELTKVVFELEKINRLNNHQKSQNDGFIAIVEKQEINENCDSTQTFVLSVEQIDFSSKCEKLAYENEILKSKVDTMEKFIRELQQNSVTCSSENSNLRNELRLKISECSQLNERLKTQNLNVERLEKEKTEKGKIGTPPIGNPFGSFNFNGK